MSKVVTRFPPSPTGNMTLGNARTALFNYLFAKHHGGTMYFRFEDTDKERSKKEYEESILRDLDWLGIEYEWPDMHRQSERTDVYQKYFKTLIDTGLAYEAEPSTDNPDKKVVRFKNPNTVITFNDLIRGEVTFDTTELKDFVIAKNIDEPLYHVAVVIDDHEMGVTHVIRGDDHISNTPRQILILEALGFTRPAYAHLPLILAKDRTKLSKRNGSVTIGEYADAGYLPDALINYLGLLGWNPGTDKEIFTKGELIQAFSFDQVQKSGAIFDEVKLKWVNREHMLKLDDEKYVEESRTHSDILEKLPALLPLIRDRVSTFGEIADMVKAGEFEYFMKAPTCDPESLAWTKDPSPEKLKSRLEEAYKLLEAVPVTAWGEVSVKAALWPYAEQEGRGSVLWPVRYALSGREKSPDPFTVAGILGRDETLQRIRTAIDLSPSSGRSERVR